MGFAVDEPKITSVPGLGKLMSCHQRGFPTPSTFVETPKKIFEYPIDLLKCGGRGHDVHHMICCDALKNMLNEQHLFREGKKMISPSNDSFANPIEKKVEHFCPFQLVPERGPKVLVEELR